MKKLIVLALTVIMALGMMAGCGSQEAAQQQSTEAPAQDAAATEAPAQEADTQIGGTVSTDGSTSMEKLMEIYMEVYGELSGTTINYNPTGSGSGITAVTEGRCDIGLASRDLKEEEAAGGLTGHVVAIDGIAIIVNPENTVEDLSIEDIAKLYTGEITNWSELGGADAPVVLIGRESGSGTRDGFEEVVGVADACQYSQELSSTGDVVTTVAGNPNAIGYASLSAVKDNVKALKVDGVVPTEESVQDGSYKVQRNFVMVTNDNAELSEAAQAFLDWALSAEADEFVKEAGCVPIKH